MKKLLTIALLTVAVTLLATGCQGIGGHRNPNLAVDSDTIVITHPEAEISSLPDTLSTDSLANDSLANDSVR